MVAAWGTHPGSRGLGVMRSGSRDNPSLRLFLKQPVLHRFNPRHHAFLLSASLGLRSRSMGCPTAEHGREMSQ